MAKLMCVAAIMVCFFSAQSAFAAGGTCPSGANYTSLTNPTGPLVTLSSLGITSCYFVAANGSDANNGTSESTPWLHAPFMPNCSNNCATVTSQNASLWPGIGIVFRGGDTWHFGASTSPAAGGTWEWNTGTTPVGTSSHPIYLGIDPGWYSGGSWSRPILTADNPLCNSSTVGTLPGGATCTSTSNTGCLSTGASYYNQPCFYVSSCGYQIGSANNFVDTTSGAYFIFDNFEMTGLCQSSLNQPSHHDNFFSYGSAQGPLYFQNLYVHGTTHRQFQAVNSANCTGIVCFNIYVFDGGVTGTAVGETIQKNVLDFSDSDPSGQGVQFGGGGYNYAYNVIRYTSNLIPGNFHLFHDNLYEYFFENGHANMLETFNDVAGTNAVYNNVFRHIETYVTSGGGVGFWLLPRAGTTDYVFNNLMHDVGRFEYFNVGSGGQTNGTYTVFNNTFQTNVSQYIFGCGNSTTTFTLLDTNNHFIDDGSQYSSPCYFTTTTSALLMSNATATSDGYTSLQASAYSPTASSSPTVGAGTNEGTQNAAYCSALTTAAGSDSTLSDAASACSHNTRYACGYVTSTHSVSCGGPLPAVVARPASAKWDIGAYQMPASAPASPTNPSAAVAQ